MVLKANDRRTSCPCHDEFRGPRSDYVRQVASENNNITALQRARASLCAKGGAKACHCRDECVNPRSLVRDVLYTPTTRK
ncbi:hypothetical protein TNCV_1030891 [Trichonephila clavipes]|nr:hypothetical protein TNCV_1030891 [Trichonephila clavipes]